VCEGARLSKVSQESDFGLPWILRWGGVRVEGGGSEDEIANLYRRARPALLAYAYRLAQVPQLKKCDLLFSVV